MPGIEQIDPRKIWKNYVMALVILFVLVSVSHFAETLVGGASAQDVALINESGQQRALSQRILYFGTAYQHSGYTDDILRTGLESALNEFEYAHEHLVAAADQRDLVHIYFADHVDARLDHDARRFIADAYAILDGPIAGRDRAIADMQRFAPHDLLKKLDDATHIYEDITSANADRVRLVSHIGYGLALAALAIVGLFIFRPSHQTIVMAFSQLEDAKSALEARERDAFAALEEAEEAWADAEAARVATEASNDQSHARLANVGYELEPPLTALRMALNEAKVGQTSGERRQALGDASRFAEVGERLRWHLLPEEASNADDSAPSDEKYDLKNLCRLAVSTVTSCDPDKPGIVLSLPPKSTPMITGDAMALFRTLCHFLRDARDMEGSSDVHLEATVEAQPTEAEITLRVTQTLGADDDYAVLGHSIIDKHLSPLESRASILSELVDSLGGEAKISRDGETREVILSFVSKRAGIPKSNRARAEESSFRRAGL